VECGRTTLVYRREKKDLPPTNQKKVDLTRLHAVKLKKKREGKGSGKLGLREW